MAVTTDIKRALARGAGKLGLSRAGRASLRMLARSHVRAVNYHDVSPGLAAAFERQLRFYAQHYVNVDRAGLSAFLAGRWQESRPGLLLSFDDGTRSHFEVVAPMLERYGFTGWFFVPASMLSLPVADQVAAGREASIRIDSRGYTDERIFLSWTEARELSRRHVVGCHSATHPRLSAQLGEQRLRREIVDAKAELEAQLQREVEAFCWVGGEEWSYSAPAAALVREAGYRYAFMTNNAVIRAGTNPLQLQRTNIEAHDPEYLVEFQLSGALDLLYTPKRRRVNRTTA